MRRFADMCWRKVRAGWACLPIGFRRYFWVIILGFATGVGLVVLYWIIDWYIRFLQFKVRG